MYIFAQQGNPNRHKIKSLELKIEESIKNEKYKEAFISQKEIINLIEPTSFDYEKASELAVQAEMYEECLAMIEKALEISDSDFESDTLYIGLLKRKDRVELLLKRIINSNEIEFCGKIWMSCNLNVDHYRNGDPIKEAKSFEEWEEFSEEKVGAWCYPRFNPVFGEIYGKLYNWYAINDPRGLAPEGWQVPTDEDWKKLEMCLGMGIQETERLKERGTNEGSKMAFGNNWPNSDSLRNNPEFGTSGFKALFEMYITNYNNIKDGIKDGLYGYEKWEKLEEWAYDFFTYSVYCVGWWTSTESNEFGTWKSEESNKLMDRAWGRSLCINTQGVWRFRFFKAEGCYVRCVRD
jgi:uncharacterized protein (TIGR02145 family)